MSRSRRADRLDGPHHGRLGEFLKSLLSGIPWSESAERTDVTRYESPKGHLLRVRNANGRIDLVGEERSDVLVTAAKRARAESQEEAERLLEAIRLAETDTGESLDLEVEIPRKWNRHGHVALEIRVPRRLEVHCESVNGKLSIVGLRAKLMARSTNGAVSVEDVVGDVAIQTANAKVTCSDTCGRLMARSSNSKIELTDHRGSIDASTSNGLIRASVEELGSGGVMLATSNGRVVLELPESADAEVDVRVDNGLIRNELPLAGETRTATGRLRGTLNAGGVPIRLRTSNGSVSLRGS